MRVIFLMNGTTHYYNRVLSKLNLEPNVEITMIIPANASDHVGAGVFQTTEGINYKLIKLEEVPFFGATSTFKGLAGVLSQEKPNIVVVIESYLYPFILDISVVITMKTLRAGLILKDHPFRLPTYQEVCKKPEIRKIGFARFPPVINDFLLRTGMMRPLRYVHWPYRRVRAAIRKLARCSADAHVNYVEAYELLGSWGIPQERIFITRNSPDTDLLFSVKDSLVGKPSALPANPYRLIHVGRLVEWKRVDMLIRAFARVRARFPEAELLIVGTGPEEDSLAKLCDELHLGKSVIFTGGVYTPQLLGQYLMASRLYILAGMGGLSINDAMCFGLPVLCSIGDGTEKILVREGINGRYFCDGDENDLFEKIIWFFEHPEQSKEMGLKSEEIIRNEVNIHTVINGYMEAFRYVRKKKSLECH